MRLRGKTAIVTGAGSGFGAGIAAAFVGEGARVLVADINGDAARAVARRVKSGELDVEDINEEIVAENLYTEGIPDPDLMIRTSGEQRVSNFLLWQSAGSKIYFTDAAWPDFDGDGLDEAIALVR